ncbi:MAG: histidine utilization repressor [Kiloniellales bacterium]
MDFELRLDGDGPLYQQIKRAIAGPILAGEFPPGHRIPSEHALMTSFGVSRMTVNRALRALAEDGMVVRRRRNGTFVAPQSAEHALLRITDIGAEIEEAGGRYGYELMRRRRFRADERKARRLGVPRRTAVLHLVCRHLSDATPVLIEDRLINLEAVPKAEHAPLDHTPPGRWLLANVPWSSAEHVIRAVNASPEVAASLEIPKGAACLVVDRHTWQSGMPITAVSLTYPGDRHRLVGRFTPEA